MGNDTDPIFRQGFNYTRSNSDALVVFDIYPTTAMPRKGRYILTVCEYVKSTRLILTNKKY